MPPRRARVRRPRGARVPNVSLHVPRGWSCCSGTSRWSRSPLGLPAPLRIAEVVVMDVAAEVVVVGGAARAVAGTATRRRARASSERRRGERDTQHLGGKSLEIHWRPPCVTRKGMASFGRGLLTPHALVCSPHAFHSRGCAKVTDESMARPTTISEGVILAAARAVFLELGLGATTANRDARRHLGRHHLQALRHQGGALSRRHGGAADRGRR